MSYGVGVKQSFEETASLVAVVCDNNSMPIDVGVQLRNDTDNASYGIDNEREVVEMEVKYVIVLKI
jgi:hypothetical protein